MTHPADMPVGTVITDGTTTATKTRRSDRDPWPWTSDGVAYPDEWAAGLLAAGGHVRTPEMAR